MKILLYADLDPGRLRPQFDKVVSMLERDDFFSAEVKKLAERDLYRAKLDYSNRLLFRIARHGGERYALLLEIVENHAYGKSRFLRGAHIDEAKLTPIAAESLPDGELPAKQLDWVGRHGVLCRRTSTPPIPEGLIRSGLFSWELSHVPHSRQISQMGHDRYLRADRPAVCPVRHRFILQG